MRMNLYVATCSLLAYTGLAYSMFDQQDALLEDEFAQDYDYDFD